MKRKTAILQIITTIVLVTVAGCIGNNAKHVIVIKNTINSANYGRTYAITSTNAIKYLNIPTFGYNDSTNYEIQLACFSGFDTLFYDTITTQKLTSVVNPAFLLKDDKEQRHDFNPTQLKSFEIDIESSTVKMNFVIQAPHKTYKFNYNLIFDRATKRKKQADIKFLGSFKREPIITTVEGAGSIKTE